jgi:dipeptidyl aminopeptidase/acylaminoacyl peptidase
MMIARMRLSLAKAVPGLLLALALPQAAQSQSRMSDAYARAERVLDANLAGAIKNGAVVPHWVEGGKRFWYQRQGREGAEWLIVDPATGVREPAFDHGRLRQGLEKVAGGQSLPNPLPISEIGADAITVTLADRVLRCQLADYLCSSSATPTMPGVIRSPDGRHGVSVRRHNLWLHREQGEPIALTGDGVAHFAYGTLPGTSLFAIPSMRAQQPLPPTGVSWSPDGRYLLSERTDERAVRPYPFVESVPQDGSFRPKLWQPRIPLLGDAERGVQEVALFEVASRRKTLIALPEGWTFHDPVFAWSSDMRRAWGLAATRGQREIALVEIDLTTGRTRLVVREATPINGRFNAFIYNPPNVRVLEARNEVIWFSERDGWGQLYLYDLRSGTLKHKLTDGQRSVRDVIAIDEQARRVFFTAGGRDDDEDAYHVRLHSVPLDGGAQTSLTPEPGVHVVRAVAMAHAAADTASTAGLSPDGRYFIDSYSTLDQPPLTVLRSALDGRVLHTLENADVSAISASGWRSPTRVKLQSADGRTPIWGTVYFPPDMLPGKKYPVIDAIYGGPQITSAPASYPEAVAAMNPRARASLAELGFIVLTIDGRGTPGRSKAFNNESFEAFAEPQLADHVAGIRQLAERYGNFDLDRVGIYGHSFGGYTSARAILTYPEFYKVAVSSAGPQNFQGFYPIEGVFPIPDYGNGRTTSPSPRAIPHNYASLDMLPLAGKLKGKLLLVYGELDENALPAVTLQLVDALTKANKPYDLMYLPNRAHGFFRTDAYYTQRMWDYFVEHLLGQMPPSDFQLRLAAPPPAVEY